MANYSISPKPEAPVLVIGAAGIDLVGRLQSDLHKGTSSPAKIRSSFGGVARNVAENLARLGTPVCLLTAVGQDDAGDRILKQAAEAGVDTEHVLCCQEQATGTYLAVVNRKGELDFGLDDMRVIRSVTSDYLRKNELLFRNASLLFIDMNLEAKTIRTAMSLARRFRLPVFSDPTSSSLAPRMLPYLDRLYFITPNSSEAAVLCNYQIDPQNHEQARKAASYLVSEGVEIVVLTQAEFGLTYATADESGYIPAISTEIVDPTGAGDALTAAVIFGLLNDIPLDESMRLGVAAASLTLRFSGAVRPDLSLEKLYDHLVI